MIRLSALILTVLTGFELGHDDDGVTIEGL